MNSSINRNIVFTVLTIFVISFWFISNNSYELSRDGSVYSSYSIEDATKLTNEIRYLTKHDIYKAASLPAYRAVLGTFIELFGDNVIGVRIINLFFFLLFISILFLVSKKFDSKNSHIVLLTLSVLFMPRLVSYMFKARPDWTIYMLVIIVALLLAGFIISKEKKYYYAALVSSAFAASFYYNGLGLLFGFGIVGICLTFYKYLSLKSLLVSWLVLACVLLITLVFPLYNISDEFNALFFNKHSNANVIATGVWYTNYFISLKATVINGYFNSRHMIFGILIISTLGYYLIRQKSYTTTQKHILLVVFILWIVGYLTVVARSPNPRHTYFFFYLIYVFIFFMVSFSQSTKVLDKLFKLFLTIILLMLISTTTKRVIKNMGYNSAYGELTEDFKKYVPTDEGRVLTLYTFRQALSEHAKIYFMPFLAIEPKKEIEVLNVFNKYNINYVTVDERTRDKLNGTVNSDIKFYKYINNILNTDFHKIQTVYNSKYNRNKSKKPINGDKWSIEIWERKN